MERFDLNLWPQFRKKTGHVSSLIDQITLNSKSINSPHSLFVALKGNREDGHQYVAAAAKAGAKFALVDHRWQAPEDLGNIDLLRVEDPLKAFQEIAAIYRQQLSAKVIAITGSHGKTLLKDLLQTMIRTTKRTVASPESFNSQIGVPLSLLTIGNEDEVAIIEAGISKKNEMEILAQLIAPDCVIVTTIGNAHIATLKTLDIVAEEKLKLVTHNSNLKWSLLPRSPHVTPLLPQIKSEYFFWDQEYKNLPHAIKKQSNHLLTYHIWFPDGKSYSGKITSGFWYVLDLINMAIKAAWLMEIPSEAIIETLESYHPEPMQTEIWKSPQGTTFINETYCSDPQSIDLALRKLDQAPSFSRRVFAFGGMRGKREQVVHEYKRIGEAIGNAKLDILMLFGNHNYSCLLEEVKKLSPKTDVTICSTYQEAVNQMRLRIQENDFVLIKGDKKEPLEKVTEAFHDSISNNQCLVNLGAIKSNLESISERLTPQTRIMVMVKALAYGTDDVRMAKFLTSCNITILGVSYVEEGVALKRAGVSQDIFVLNAALYEVAKVVRWDLEVGVSDENFINFLANEAKIQNKKIKVHLHIDTGMSRFGCRPEEALLMAKKIAANPSLVLEGIMTHFAVAESPQQDFFTKKQIATFENVIEELKREGIYARWYHAANSAAAIRFSLPQFNMVRLGLAVYGLYPSEEVKQVLELKLALSLVSRIVGINVCKKGETISYGRSYIVSVPEQRIGVIPIGYFDGLHRNYSGKGEVIVRGNLAPMVGNICMDFMMIDVTHIPEVQVGDSVLIFGNDEYGHFLSPEALAGRGDSIVHELITCLGPRIQRIFINE